MYVIVSTYRAKVGEEDAIIALHEDLQHGQNMNAGCYHSWELLGNAKGPREFLSVAQFANEGSAQEAIKALDKDGWYNRLVSLVERRPKRKHYTIAWRLHS